MRSGSTLVIRRVADGDDFGAAGRMVQAAYFSLPGYPRDDEYDALLGDVASRARDAEVEVLVGVLDGRIVGCLTFLPSLDNDHAEFVDPNATSFRYFGVDPAAQGSGVGEAMVRWCLDETARLGQQRCRIHTLLSMPGAQRLYERLGFVRTPEHDADWDGIVGLALSFEIDAASAGHAR